MNAISNWGWRQISLVFAMALVAGCDAGAAPQAPANVAAPAASSIPPDRLAAAQRALAAESQIRSARYEAPIWRVRVADDGTRRDGYAEYVCTVLGQQRAVGPETAVTVLDQADDGQLGYALCRTS